MSVVDDFKFALRGLSHARGFSAIAMLTIALGIGSATLMFALVDSILLEPLPVAQPQRLVVAWKRTSTGTFSHYPFGADAIHEVKTHARSFQAVAAFSYNGAMQFPAIEGDVASYISTGVVDGDFFKVLDVIPLLGRTLAASDDAPGAEAVLVIDERLWDRRYNRSRDVIGKRVRMFDEAFTIVGVVPAVDLPRGAEAWVTLHGGDARSTSPASREALRSTQDLVARLQPNVTFADATSELESLTVAYEKRFGREIVASVTRYTDEVVGSVRQPVMMLLGATLLVLLIACANVANLILLRSEERQAQFALRSALGANRGRLIQHVVLEALVLCTVGAAVGVLIAYTSLDWVLVFAPGELPRSEGVEIDGTVVVFVTVATLFATAAASIVPTLFSTNGDRAVLGQGSARVTPSAFRFSRRALVVTQIALSVVILAAAGILTRTVLKLQSAEMGFAAQRLAFVELFLPLGKYEDPRAKRPFLEDLTASVQALPGVEAAAPIAVAPYAGLSGWDIPRWVAEGQDPENAARNPGLDLQSVYPGHFETMGIEILEGRALNRFDRQSATAAAVISEDAARHVWPGESAIGKRFKWGGSDSKSPWVTIVGVSAMTRYRELAEPRATVYLPAAQFIDGANSLALRLAVPLNTVTSSIRQRVRELDRDVFVLRAQPFSSYLEGPMARPRFVSFLASIFGGTALLLTVVGLYGVLASFVRNSAREIGVRMALGASVNSIRGFVFDEIARVLAVGIFFGLTGALAMGEVVRSMLFGVQPNDPLTLTAAVMVMIAAGVTACYLPVHRATRIDPISLLRSD